MTPGGVLVGVDGSLGSVDALRWAIRHTSEFGPVRPVIIWDYPLRDLLPPPLGPSEPPTIEEMEARALDGARPALDEAGATDHADVEEPLILRGEAGPVLVEAAAEAALLVVGTRSRGPVRSNMIGSVGRHCADSATVPMVVVPHLGDEAPPSDDGPYQVVVGVDGSDNAQRALEWAVRNAPADAEITAVTTWQTPVDLPFALTDNRFDVRVLRADATQRVNEAADKACAQADAPADRVLREITEGDPRWVLLSRSEAVDLLVLGRRGRTGLPHFFLGSTTTALIHRPRCPIAVVPG